jgi:hypothetical protein
MNNTLLIQVNNQQSLNLLYKMNDLHLIKVLQEHVIPEKTKRSEKYRGVFSKEDAKSFDEHIQTMRNEWDTI